MLGFLKNISLKCARCAPTTCNETLQNVYENKNKIHNIQSAVMVIIMVHGLDETVPLHATSAWERKNNKYSFELLLPSCRTLSTRLCTEMSITVKTIMYYDTIIHCLCVMVVLINIKRTVLTSTSNKNKFTQNVIIQVLWVPCQRNNRKKLNIHVWHHDADRG